MRVLVGNVWLRVTTWRYTSIGRARQIRPTVHERCIACFLPLRTGRECRASAAWLSAFLRRCLPSDRTLSRRASLRAWFLLYGLCRQAQIALQRRMLLPVAQTGTRNRTATSAAAANFVCCTTKLPPEKTAARIPDTYSSNPPSPAWGLHEAAACGEPIAGADRLHRALEMIGPMTGTATERRGAFENCWHAKTLLFRLNPNRL
jgi:hypothetical protein